MRLGAEHNTKLILSFFIITKQGLLKNHSLSHLSFKGSGIGDRATEGL